MSGTGVGQLLWALPSTKTDRAFSRKKRENVLKKPADNTFKRPKHENVLELADAVCLLGNVRAPAPTGMPKAVHAKKRAERVAAVFDFLGQPQWKAHLDEILFYFDLLPEYLFQAEKDGEISSEIVTAVLTLGACAKFGSNLTALILDRAAGYDFFVQEEPKMFRGRLDPATGKPSLEPFSLLGPYQGAFFRALEHPKLDNRRFKHCIVCGGFYYQRRLSSRACTRKCVNLLMAREHLERKRMVLARKAEGKQIPEIALELSLSPFQVRRLLKKT